MYIKIDIRHKSLRHNVLELLPKQYFLGWPDTEVAGGT